jgi:hypothetical protein
MTPTRRRVSSISSAELGIREGMRMKQSDDAQSARLQGLTGLSDVLSSKFQPAWLKSPISEKHETQGARFCGIDDQQADHLEPVGLLSMPRTAMQPPKFPEWKTKRPYHLCSVRPTSAHHRRRTHRAPSSAPSGACAVRPQPEPDRLRPYVHFQRRAPSSDRHGV